MVLCYSISAAVRWSTLARWFGLKSGVIGSLGLDVYEEEDSLFFRDLSNSVIRDDVFARLLIFPNVLITGHQAFFTHEALTEIAKKTIENGQRCLPNFSWAACLSAVLARRYLIFQITHKGINTGGLFHSV